MKVSELITQLLWQPQDVEVVLDSGEPPRVRRLGYRVYLEAPCEWCEQPSRFYTGIPGVLASIVDGRPVGDINRCDVCCVYTSDEEAAEALYRALTRLHGNDVNFTE